MNKERVTVLIRRKPAPQVIESERTNAVRPTSIRVVSVVVLFGWLLCSPSFGQYAGPSEQGRPATVQQAMEAQVGTYVAVTGRIVSHLREDYYLFRDDTGEIRIEVEDSVWRGRKVGPETVVRLVAERDRTGMGQPYLWVQSLEFIEDASGASSMD